jgi:hypothetical protein
MTTYTYPLYTRGTNPVSGTFPVSAAVQQIVQGSVTFSAAVGSATGGSVNGPVLPAGARISNIFTDVKLVWDSVSGTALHVGITGALQQYASGVDLQTAGRKTPTFGAANVSAMNVILSVDTTLVFTVSVNGSVVPSAGNALVYIQYY